MANHTLTSLLRIDTPSDGCDLHAHRQLAIEAGFDGVEVALDQTPVLPKAEALFASCPVSPPEEAQEHIIALLDRAAAIGARCMNLTLTPIQEQNGYSAPTIHRDMTSLAYRLLHNIRFEAERFGVMIALEAGAHGHLLSPIELREVIDAVNSWAIGVCVDVNRLAGFSHPADWIGTLGRRIHTIRINDAKDAASEGSLDAHTISTALNHIAYNGILIVGGVGSPKEIRSAMQLPLPLLRNRDNICVGQE